MSNSEIPVINISCQSDSGNVGQCSVAHLIARILAENGFTNVQLSTETHPSMTAAQQRSADRALIHWSGREYVIRIDDGSVANFDTPRVKKTYHITKYPSETKLLGETNA